VGGSIRGRLVILLGVWLMLRQVDGVLSSLQSGGRGGYGANALGPLSPADLPARVADALSVWESTRPVSHVAFGVYTALDVVFIGLYVWVFLSLFAKLDVPLPASQMATPARQAVKRAWLWVVALAVFDVAEDAIRAVMVGWHSSPAGLVYAGYAVSLLKLGALVCVLLLLFVAWRQVGLGSAPGRFTAATGWALGRMRVPLVLLGAWGLFVTFDPSGQTADTFRRWLDSPSQFAKWGVFTMLAVVLLGLATWTTARRGVLSGYTATERPPSPRRWLVVLLVLVGGGVAGWANLMGFAVTLGIVFVLGALAFLWHLGSDGGQQAIWARQAERATQQRGQIAGAPIGSHRAEVRRVARALATWPLLALLLGAASAWTAPAVVLLAQREDESRAILAALFAVVALVAAAGVAHLAPSALRKWARWQGASPSRTNGLEWRHAVVAGLCFALCIAAVAWPLDVPGYLGVVAMTALVIAVLVVALGEGQRYGDVHPPTVGLTMVGFRRLPVTLALVIAFVIASQFDDRSYHDVYRNGDRAPLISGTPLRDAFAAWRKRNCADSGGKKRTIPLVLVAAPGGGIRAAYWTSSVLTDLLRDKPRDPYCGRATAVGRVFAMGGASGGSVGITSYLGHAGASGKWYRDTMGDSDFAAVPVTWGLLVDLPRNLIGFDSQDRARRFEQAWEREDPTLKNDFFAGQSSKTPLLMLAGTQVESGCRLSISPVRLTAQSDSNDEGACAALGGRDAVIRTGRQPTTAPRPAAALTSDVLDYLCNGASLNRSTAALLSSRFPYVSPSGRLQCEEDRPTAVVDGGYAENTGAQQVLNLWAQLEPLVAAHNANPGRTRIVPIFVEIDNHYAKAARAGPLAPTHELIVPPATKARADKLDDRGVEQLANADFSLELPGRPGETCMIGSAPTQRYVFIAPGESPGIPAPLAWTLSRLAMDDLDRQRAKAMQEEPVKRLRALLAGAAGPCTPPTARKVNKPSTVRKRTHR
jgi:hypothetical protein